MVVTQQEENNGDNNNEGIPPGGAAMDDDDQWEFGSIYSGDGNNIVYQLAQLQKEMKKQKLVCSILLTAILAIAAAVCWNAGNRQDMEEMQAKLVVMPFGTYFPKHWYN